MSTYEYMTGMSSYGGMVGLGTNGDGIVLGPGVSVPPDQGAPMPGFATATDYELFITKLKAQQGPFVYIGKDSPEGKKFVTWMALYEPTFMEWFMKLMMVKMAAAGAAIADVPDWVMGETIQFRKDLYDMYLTCTKRVKTMLAEQGKILSTTIPPVDFEQFMGWWKRWDLPGVSALIASYTANEGDVPLGPPKVEVPKKLFIYWKTTGGKVEPPKPLLGFKEESWLDWALDNWLWLALGGVGGMALGGWYVQRRRMSRNPMHENMREGWGQTLKLKSGTYKLHPILPDSYVSGMRAMNMRSANKFRVSSGGKSLGELHKSSGKRKWRARSYHGVEKYGNSRAALLEWLKKDALGEREAELMEGVHIPMPIMGNITREVL